MLYDEISHVIVSVEPGKPRQITSYEMRFYDVDFANKVTETAQEIIEEMEKECVNYPSELPSVYS